MFSMLALALKCLRQDVFSYDCAWTLIGRPRARTDARYIRSVKSSQTMAECGRVDSRTSSHTMDKSITLPPDEIFRNLENAKRFAIDIGRCQYQSFLIVYGHFCATVANLPVY